MENKRDQFLRPKQVVVFLLAHGVRTTTATLATWRSREPERLPFRRILGRIYYEKAVLEALMAGGETAGQ